MQKHKFPKIQMRLLLALALLVAIISINSIIYIHDIKSMNKLIQEIIDHPFTVSNSARDIEININAIHRSMKDAVLSKNENQLNMAITDINIFEENVCENFEILENKFLGDLNTVYEAKQTFENWKPIRDEVIVLIKENNLNEAVEITKGKGAIHVNLMFAKTHEMIDFANKKASEFNNNSIKIMRNAKNKSLLLILSTLCIGGIIFLWLFHSINKPLNHLINRIRITAKNITINEFPKQTKNKLVILDFAISELENRDKILEEEINTHTNELKEARNLLENAIDNASVGMVMMNFDGIVLNVNQAFCKFIGYSKEELINMKFNVFTQDSDKKIGLDFIDRVIDGESKNEILENIYIHKTGEIIQGLVTASVVRGSNDKAIYLFAQVIDVTKQKQYELELIEHKIGLEYKVKERTKELDDKTDKLIKSQKALTYLLEDVNESQEKMKLLNQQIKETNKELETFSYSVSHDLKAPLRAVIGFSQILEEDYSAHLDQEAIRYIGLIKGNAEKMGVLISDLLNFSRLGRKALIKTQVDLKAISERVKIEIEAGLQTRKPTFKINPMPMANADESLLYHVMQNLISNAVKFSTLSANPLIEIGCSRQKNKNAYYVKDNGIGLDMKYAEKIFEIFQRLHIDKEYEGTGIGLAIVQRIILKHEGRIWVESEKNKGTTFFFVL